MLVVIWVVCCTLRLSGDTLVGANVAAVATTSPQIVSITRLSCDSTAAAFGPVDKTGRREQQISRTLWRIAPLKEKPELDPCGETLSRHGATGLLRNFQSQRVD